MSVLVVSVDEDTRPPRQGLLLYLGLTLGSLMSRTAGSEDDEGYDPQRYLLSEFCLSTHL